MVSYGRGIVAATAVVAVFAGTALLAGCGGSGGGSAFPTPTPTLPGTSPSPTPTPSASPSTGQAPIPATGQIPVTNTAPATRHITAADLPPPFQTDSANNNPSVVARPDGAGLSVPPGFYVYQWADNLPGARSMAVAPNGDVFLVQSQNNTITVLRDADHDGVPETRATFASGAGLNLPFGIAFYPAGPNPSFVYVANTDGVVRYPYTTGALQAPGGAQTIVSGLPSGDGHWTRGLAFRADGAKMYVSVGSSGNVDEGEDPRRAAILEFNPDGSGGRTFATGMRNPVTLAIDPMSGALWTTVNERDGLGDDLVPDYATPVTDGGFYGWPYFYIGSHPEPRVTARPDLASSVLIPDVLIQAHSAPLGIAFYTGTAFPATYQDSAFIGLHGSWNRSQRTGYKVIHTTPGGGYEDFVWGWATSEGTVWGRPVGIATAADSSLLISDDGANCIWRVTYGLTPLGKSVRTVRP